MNPFTPNPTDTNPTGVGNSDGKMIMDYLFDQSTHQLPAFDLPTVDYNYSPPSPEQASLLSYLWGWTPEGEGKPEGMANSLMEAVARGSV